MINIFLIILAVIIVPLAESFFWTVGIGSLIMVLAVQWISHSRNNILRLVILLIAGLIFDAGMGLNMGTSTIVISTAILGYVLLEKFVPMQNAIIKYIGLFMLFLIGSILFGFFSNGVLTISLIPTSSFILSILKSTFADLIIFFVIDVVSGMFSSPSNNKLKI